jgi:O-acetyl-ADP-ribose deacetylase (regulator of RNase III)
MSVVFKRGDLFAQDADALVNTVNCVGVMGKGVALEFKRRWPNNYAAYRLACQRKSLRPGILHIFQVADLLSNDDPKFIINFPTKDHWRSKSQLSYIEDGLDALVETLTQKCIGSIAMPPLGCGNGGLDWRDVKPLIEQKLRGVSDVEIVVLEPEANEEHPEHDTSTLSMTYPRAVLIRALAELETVFDGSFDRLSLQKIVYFLQALGVPFNVGFDQRLFGPFSSELKKALFALERQGFLEGFSSEDRSARVPPGAYASADEFLKSSGQDSNAQAAIDRLYHLIAGYEGPFGLELLSSVHQLASNGLKSDEEVVSSMMSATGIGRNRYSEAPIKAAYQRLVADGLISTRVQRTFA